MEVPIFPTITEARTGGSLAWVTGGLNIAGRPAVHAAMVRPVPDKEVDRPGPGNRLQTSPAAALRRGVVGDGNSHLLRSAHLPCASGKSLMHRTTCRLSGSGVTGYVPRCEWHLPLRAGMLAVICVIWRLHVAH